jgi:hypothetical protein
MADQGTTRLRASDSERERVASAIRDAMSEGRLTLAEGEERLAAVYATTYRDELPPMTADLPPPERTDGAAARPTGARPGRPWRHPGRRPGLRPGLLLTGLAVAIGIVVLAAGRPLWPAIALGVVALLLIKRSRCWSP